jgi:O-antigen/teichoic acid export membrane protein
MFKNIVANLIGRIWGTISKFLFIPLYIHYLGFDNYSVISFTLVIASFMMMLDAGVSATLSREFARGDQSHEEKVRVFNTLESIYLILVCICIIVAFLMSRIIAEDFLKLDFITTDKLTQLLNIIGVEASFQLLIRFYIGGLLGLEKQIKANAYQVGWGVFRNGGVVLAIIIVPHLEVFFIWQCFSTIVFSCLLRGTLCKVLIGKYLYFKFKIERVILNKNWKFASGMFIIAFVAGMNTQLDKFIISISLPIEVLGYYTLAVSLAIGIIVIVTPISTALLPRFTALYSSGKVNEATKLFNISSFCIAILVFSIMSNMVFNSAGLLWVWTGKMDLAREASIYLPIMALSMAMLALTIMPYSIAIANGYTKLNNTMGLVSLLVTLPGYWFATKLYGAIGAAIVFCIVQIVMTLVYTYYINKKFIKRKSIIYEYLRVILFPLVISFILAYGFNFIFSDFQSNRFVSLLRICGLTLLTLICTALIIKPRKIYHYLAKYVELKVQ